jgi:K+-transporting ATPase ATPase C chain
MEQSQLTVPESSFRGLLRPAAILFVLLSVVTGLAYPLLITGLAQAVFPTQANGSLIMLRDQPVGSRLIGQGFADPGHFWGRPSATAPMGYNAAASSGSNLGPTNPALVAAVEARVSVLRAADPGNTTPVPVDLVTASASGLDPHISLAAAGYQAARIARVREVSVEQVRELIARYTEGGAMGLSGELRLNVLELNLALDAMPR